MIHGWGISCVIALLWMSLDFIDDQSTLVQIMAWCHQETSHYLSQCWPGSLSPYGITWSQWVISLAPTKFECKFTQVIFMRVIDGGLWYLLWIYPQYPQTNLTRFNGDQSPLVQVMAWYHLGNKPLPEPMLTQIRFVIWLHQATMS